MGIKFNELKGTHKVTVCMRHPISRKPITKTRDGLKSKAKALREEKKLRAELAIKLDRDSRAFKEPSWSTFLSRYYVELDRRDISKKTIDNIKLCLGAYTREVWGEKLISEISGQEIRELIRKHESLSESHKKNILKYIRGCFNYAVESGALKVNPTPQMKFRIGDKLTAVLTIPQVKIILDYCRRSGEEWYPIIATALYTGLRNGELYALTWDKVDLDKRTALIDTSWNSKDGFKDTKSGDDRIIELAPELVQIFKELKLKYSACSNFVLPRIDKWDKGEQARELRRILMGLGLPRVRFHDLRATWATIMLSRGIAPIKVMSMGGWKDLKTMQRYIRKAGVDISGISDGLSLHNPFQESGSISILHSS
jgi:integrase